MPMVTFFDENDFKEYAVINDDSHLNEIFQEVRSKFPDYYVEKRIGESSLFGYSKKEDIFIVYYKVNDYEVQVLQLPNTGISRDCLIAFFYGLLNN